MDSILRTIKKLLGIDESIECFDTDIIVAINSALSILTQIGVGPRNGFSIIGEEETWSFFMGEDERLELVKMYVYLKVRLMFDPPSSSYVLESMKQMANEYEWRISVTVD